MILSKNLKRLAMMNITALRLKQNQLSEMLGEMLCKGLGGGWRS